jgi:hypothetical protein
MTKFCKPLKFYKIDELNVQKYIIFKALTLLCLHGDLYQYVSTSTLKRDLQ